MGPKIFKAGDEVTLTDEAKIRYRYAYVEEIGDELIGVIKGEAVEDCLRWMVIVDWNQPVAWGSQGPSSSRHYESSLRLVGPVDPITAGARAYVKKELAR